MGGSLIVVVTNDVVSCRAGGRPLSPPLPHPTGPARARQIKSPKKYRTAGIVRIFMIFDLLTKFSVYYSITKNLVISNLLVLLIGMIVRRFY
jgi:hypothetical protein